jgi:hypothetical protein
MGFSAKRNARAVRAWRDAGFTQAVSILARAWREHCALRRAGRRAFRRSGTRGRLLLRAAGRRTRRRRDRRARLSPRGWPRGPSRRHRTGLVGRDQEGSRRGAGGSCRRPRCDGRDDAPDRYGRQVAFVYLAGTETLVQAELLRQGEALGSADATDKDCAMTLAAAEAEARQAKRGTWADAMVIKNAESSDDILAGIGRFTLVEGKVLSVRQAGATTYLISILGGTGHGTLL